MPSENTTPNPAQADVNPAHNPAHNGAAKELSTPQIAALDALLAGSSAADAAAAAAGVDRRTLYNWLRKNFIFQAALNRGRRELRRAVVQRLERLANNATECVDKAVREGNLKAALEIVKRLDLFSGKFLGSDAAAELELDEQERLHKLQRRTKRAEQQTNHVDRYLRSINRL